MNKEMMKRLLSFVVCLFSLFSLSAQKAVVEEYAIDVNCENATHAIQHFREVTTIQNEQGASLALFVCSCSKNDKLTSFKGQVADATGRVIRKLKESELQKTEYSPSKSATTCSDTLVFTTSRSSPNSPSSTAPSAVPTNKKSY